MVVSVLYANNGGEFGGGRKTDHIVLSDIDHTTKVEGEFKRLNTLAHYKVWLVFILFPCLKLSLNVKLHT